MKKRCEFCEDKLKSIVNRCNPESNPMKCNKLKYCRDCECEYFSEEMYNGCVPNTISCKKRIKRFIKL